MPHSEGIYLALVLREHSKILGDLEKGDSLVEEGESAVSMASGQSLSSNLADFAALVVN